MDTGSSWSAWSTRVFVEAELKEFSARRVAAVCSRLSAN